MTKLTHVCFTVNTCPRCSTTWTHKCELTCQISIKILCLCTAKIPRDVKFYVFLSERASYIISSCLHPCVMYEHLPRKRYLACGVCVCVCGGGTLQWPGGCRGRQVDCFFYASGGRGAVAVAAVESRRHDAAQVWRHSRLIASPLPQS